jgi:diacylglycerol kinase family enzyme
MASFALMIPLKPVPRQAVLVVNAHSRRGRALFRDAVVKLKAAGIELLARHAVRDPERLIPTMQEAVRSGAPMVIVGGGDGSLSCTVDEVVERDCVFALLPLGTANSFARTLGIPLDASAAAEVILDGAVEPMDLVVDEVGQVVVNSVHVGAGAQASRNARVWKERLGAIGVGRLNLGKLGYPIGAALTAWRPPVLRLRIEVDGRVVNDLDQPVLMVAIGNGASVGGGTELTPEADPGDGAVDVMVSRAVGRIARLRYAARLGLATHHRAGDVVYLRGRTVSIRGERFHCSADGEVYGPERHRTWRVEPAAYSMVLPR